MKTRGKHRLKRIMTLVTAVEIVFCIFMTINAVSAKIYIEKGVELSQKHIQYTEISNEFIKGSDILTEQVRLFAETGQIIYMNNYFEEVYSSKRRDRAIERLKEISPSVEAEKQIKFSMQLSIGLMDIEYRAMKLTAMAYGISDVYLRDEVKSIELSPREEKMTSEEMKKEARRLLFGEAYLSQKKGILSGLSNFVNKMIEKSNAEYMALTKKVRFFSTSLEVIIIIMSAMLVLMNIFQFHFVVNPLVKATGSITQGDKISLPEFLLEMDSLGTSYNNLLSENESLVSQLRALAETDALTRLGNRASYNEYGSRLQSEGGEVLLFVFDVNDLRKVNNTQGHNAGDELLRNCAECILSVFADDAKQNCFRIGGDEFVAFICGKPEAAAAEYIEKFKEVQKKQGVSLACGYAYTKNIKNEAPNHMFNSADKMMYAEKAKLKAADPNNNS